MQEPAAGVAAIVAGYAGMIISAGCFLTNEEEKRMASSQKKESAPNAIEETEKCIARR